MCEWINWLLKWYQWYHCRCFISLSLVFLLFCSVLPYTNGVIMGNHIPFLFILDIPPYQIIVSRDGSRVLSMEGYRFHLKYGSHSHISKWQCASQSVGCKVVLHTVHSRVMKIEERHNHPPKFLRDKLQTM